MATLVEFKAPLASPPEYVSPFLYAGQRTTARVRVVQADRITAVSLSGLTARLLGKRDWQDAAALFDVAGVVVGAAEDGTVDFDLTPAMLPYRTQIVVELRLLSGSEVQAKSRLYIHVEGGV